MYRDSGKQAKKLINDATFWSQVRLIVDITTAAVKLLRHADSGTPETVCKVYKLAAEVQQSIDLFQQLSIEQRQQLHRAWTDRWSLLHTDLHAAAYALHPEYAFHDFEMLQDPKISSGLLNMIEKVLYGSPEAQGAAMSQHVRFRNRQGIFGREMILSAAKDMPPYSFWDAFGSETPELQRVAMKICAQSTSSSACERNWADYDFVHNKRRNRLQPGRAEKLVRCFSNLRLFQLRDKVDPESNAIPWRWLPEEQQDDDSDDDHCDD
jgi:hypothetical protein